MPGAGSSSLDPSDRYRRSRLVTSGASAVTDGAQLSTRFY